MSRSKEPSVPLLARLLALAVLFAIAVAPTSADPDVWGHVLFGRDIVSARSLPAADPYSFSSDRSWVNHEWLAEVFMYLAYRAGGATGLVLLKAFVVSAVLGCIVAALRHRKFRPVQHDALIALALVGMWTRYHPVRPQIFSLLLFALLLLVLDAAERTGPRKLAWAPPLFAVWANLHGGFLVGLAVLTVWTIVSVVRAPRQWPAFVAVAASVAATLLTPYGFELWRFVWETVGTSRPDISDWRSAIVAGPLVLIPWTLVVLTAGFALWRARRTGVPIAAVAGVATLLIGTLRIGRLDAFLALSVVMLLGPVFGRSREALDSTPREPGWHPVALGAAVVLVIGASAFSPRARCVEMRNYPEAEATAFLQGRVGRLLTFFDWGQYAIWHLGPDLKVSMDGRRETVYSDALFDSHLRLYLGEPGSTSLVGALQPDFIWLPVQSPAIAMLEREGWRPAFSGPISVVLAQRVQGPARTVERPTPEPRCFPAR